MSAANRSASFTSFSASFNNLLSCYFHLSLIRILQSSSFFHLLLCPPVRLYALLPPFTPSQPPSIIFCLLNVPPPFQPPPSLHPRSSTSFSVLSSLSCLLKHLPRRQEFHALVSAAAKRNGRSITSSLEQQGGRGRKSSGGEGGQGGGSPAVPVLGLRHLFSPELRLTSAVMFVAWPVGNNHPLTQPLLISNIQNILALPHLNLSDLI